MGSNAVGVSTGNKAFFIFCSAREENLLVNWSNPPSWSIPLEIQADLLLPGAGGESSPRVGLGVCLAVGFDVAEFSVLDLVGFLLLNVTGLAVAFVGFIFAVWLEYLLSETDGLLGVGVVFCVWGGRPEASFVDSLGVLFVVLEGDEAAFDWPRLLLAWLDVEIVFGLTFFLPGFPFFVLASVPRPLAPCMIPEIPAETLEVAVLTMLSFTLRTPETTEPAAPMRPDKKPPEFPSVGEWEGTGRTLGVVNL